MKHRCVGSTLLVRLDSGEDVIGSLTETCTIHGLQTATVSAIGAVRFARIGFFDPKTKQYRFKDFTGDYELTSLLGNVSLKEGKPFLHLHATISDHNLSVVGGHLAAATVSATCEAVLSIIPTDLTRTPDPKTGLSLLDV